jgi:hypothetical protein
MLRNISSNISYIIAGVAAAAIAVFFLQRTTKKNKTEEESSHATDLEWATEVFGNNLLTKNGLKTTDEVLKGKVRNDRSICELDDLHLKSRCTYARVSTRSAETCRIVLQCPLVPSLPKVYPNLNRVL